ncbi:peptidoglycan D,D-transpeptidase FtsI family protein [Paenibacillus tarimensis]|uniref:peptidoglycan D,D-transpeptidase FtsI family protein n=1 Tax=Paenibacillus tarimensis TaxID=416012 RepID=UPI001F3648F8|nr:penicillin-binding transpeptidase domain-containing protein [Paenibacillus tarimensis]MCF2944033.1 penicillin-binding protein [Paenibacillus tarimensis]
MNGDRNQGFTKAGRARRIGLLTVLISLVYLLYIARLAVIQSGLWPAYGSVLTEHAVRQRQEGIVLDSGRGRITDRNGTVLAGQQIYALAAFPDGSDREIDGGASSKLAKLAELLHTDIGTLSGWLAAIKEPELWHKPGMRTPAALSEELVKDIKALNVKGILVVPYSIRYDESRPGIHAIGYISQNPEQIAELYASELASGKIKLSDRVGGEGLERSLDKLLRGIGPTVLYRSQIHEPAGSASREIRLKQPDNPFYPLEVTTTLDLELQQLIEEYAERAGLKEGAVVVLEADSADIAAIVSKPEFNPYHIMEGGRETVNHALQPVAPGSVFKLVTAAAALESGVIEPKETFRCNGEYGRYGLSCWLPGGHGELTLTEALAQSCNVAFAALSERLSAGKLSAAARQLGLGRRIGWYSEKGNGVLKGPLRPLAEEAEGRIFASEAETSADSGIVAQTAIGQRDAAVTPLQAANLVVSLLQGGRVLAPRLVKEIRYANGQTMMSFPLQDSPSPAGRISASTASTLLKGMEAVMDHGTGRTIGQAGSWRLAGKSGTAQAYLNGKEVNHQWFAGYGPIHSPRYAIAVLAKSRPKNSANQAAQIFHGVMKVIADQEKKLPRRS